MVRKNTVGHAMIILMSKLFFQVFIFNLESLKLNDFVQLLINDLFQTLYHHILLAALLGRTLGLLVVYGQLFIFLINFFALCLQFLDFFLVLRNLFG